MSRRPISWSVVVVAVVVIGSVAWFTASQTELSTQIGAQFPPELPGPQQDATQTLIDQALAHRFAGILEYVAPTEMEVHDTGKVTLKIAPIDLANEVNSEIVALQASRGGQSETSDVRLTSVMKAELTGSSGFHILPTGPIEQAVSSTEPTTWNWTVEALDGDDWFPSRHATRELNIALTAVLNVSGKDRDRSIGDPWEQKINVTVDWPTWTHKFVEAGMDLWWLWGICLGALLAGYGIWRRKFPKDSLLAAAYKVMQGKGGDDSV